MKVSKTCLEVLKHHEGVRQKPYLCPAKLWSIGVGHVMYPEQAKYPSTPEGMAKRAAWPLQEKDNRRFSMEEVDAILAHDLARFERGVERLITVRLTQGQFDCLVSFAFNLGLGGLQRSPVRQAVNRGDHEAAMASLVKYCKGGGKVLPGLVKRRRDERAMYLGTTKVEGALD
jgi:lysozyme